MRAYDEDTIVAVATPPGSGGVGIVRLSGPAAVEIARGCFAASGKKALGQAPSHHMLHGWVRDGQGRAVDEALGVLMRGPRSYTGEDVVEIHCHGNPLALRTVVELARKGGARLAGPGEFTMRAFLNGRVDLTRAEAVADVVRARSTLALQVSVNQLQGRLYGRIHAMREALAQVTALVAAGIDFPEEDVVFAHREDIAASLDGAAEELRDLLAGARAGRITQEGLAVAIVGRPNVGKSSLLNALLREGRAIVTDIPGTTRDTLEEMAEVGGLMVRLVDTAGIRESGDVVEREGIERARQAIARADLVLLVLEAQAPMAQGDAELLASLRPESTLVLLNKQDLPGAARYDRPGGTPPHPALNGWRMLGLSAKTGQGVAELEAAIAGHAISAEHPPTEGAVLTNLRQEEAARAALQAVERARAALEEQLGEELLAIDLQGALDALGDIVGETTTDDLLERIFSQFCIGK